MHKCTTPLPDQQPGPNPIRRPSDAHDMSHMNPGDMQGMNMGDSLDPGRTLLMNEASGTTMNPRVAPCRC